MGKSLPPLNWFRAFEAAARTLSFTAAAEEIGMTQSAVSQQVKALEQRLGTPLFERRPRGLTLTDAGRRLLPQVDAALAALTAATGGFDTAPAGPLLTVAASVSVIEWILAPRLAGFVGAHPGARLRFVSAVWPDDFARPAAVADVEIRFGSRGQAGAGAEPLMPDRLIALSAAGAEVAFDRLPLIETVGTSDGWRAWAAAGMALPAPALMADSYGVALQMAQHGHGVCLVSEVLAGHALRAGLVRRAHPLSIPAHQGYHVSAAPGHGLAAAFRDWLLAGIRP